MDTEILTAFFMWNTILNAIILVFSALFLTFAQGFVYRFHSRWYPMPRETFSVVVYSFLGVYKIFFMVFNLFPYLTLVIMCK